MYVLYTTSYKISIQGSTPAFAPPVQRRLTRLLGRGDATSAALAAVPHARLSYVRAHTQIAHPRARGSTRHRRLRHAPTPGPCVGERVGAAQRGHKREDHTSEAMAQTHGAANEPTDAIGIDRAQLKTTASAAVAPAEAPQFWI